MPSHSPYPLTHPALRILDLTPTLAVTPSTDHQLTAFNPSTPDSWSSLQICLPPLSFLLLADRLGELYETIFPDHPEWVNEETAVWESEEDVAAAVERFLQRVNTLFPVHDEIWDIDLEGLEWRLWEIPLISMGYDEWYDGWDDLKEPAPYLLHLRHSRSDNDTSSEHDEFADLYPGHQTPRYLEPHRLVETLRGMALPEPLDALADLILMLDHNTDNAWLDVGELALSEGGGYPQWHSADVDWLAEEWRRAEPILARVQRLLDWQNQTPEEIACKLTAVHDVLLDAYYRTLQTEETTSEVAV